jgi:hypothetical protein
MIKWNELAFDTFLWRLSELVVFSSPEFRDMKNAVIGNNKQKANLIVLGAVPRYVCCPTYSVIPAESLVSSDFHYEIPSLIILFLVF